MTTDDSQQTVFEPSGLQMALAVIITGLAWWHWVKGGFMSDEFKQMLIPLIPGALGWGSSMFALLFKLILPKSLGPRKLCWNLGLVLQFVGMFLFAMVKLFWESAA